MMKRSFLPLFREAILIALRSFWLVAILCVAVAQAETPPGATVDDLARVVLSYFPSGSGQVAAVSGTTAQVDLPGMPGPSAGVILSVYREKEPFHHPVTGVELGRFEEVIGEIEITQITAETISGRILGGDVKNGDRVRIPSKIPMSVSSTADSGPISSVLSAVLLETGRFQIDPVNAKYRLHVTPLPSTTHLAIRMQTVRTGRTLFEITAAVDPSKDDPVLERWRHISSQPPPVEK